MMNRILAASASLPILAGVAAAQDYTPYLEAGVGHVFEDDFNTIGVIGRGGVEFPTRQMPIDAFAIESELFYGLDGEDHGDIEAGIDYSVSLSGRAIIRPASNVDLYARAGGDISQAEIKGDGFFAGAEDEDTEFGFLIGAGAELKLSPKTGVRFDFTHRNDYEIASLSYGVRF